MPHRKKPKWTFVIPWLLANTVGVVFGSLLGFVVIILDYWFDNATIAMILSGSLLSITFGAAQALVLDERIDRKSKWIAPCAITTVIFLCMIGMTFDGSSLLSWHTIVATGIMVAAGAGCGVFQWRELRKNYTRTEWWIPLSALAWGSAIPLIAGGMNLNILNMITMPLVVLVLMWALPGIYLAYLPCKSTSLPQQFEID